jgi:hypothetical protein
MEVSIEWMDSPLNFGADSVDGFCGDGEGEFRRVAPRGRISAEEFSIVAQFLKPCHHGSELAPRVFLLWGAC